MVNINILANSWKRQNEQHPLKHQSNAKLANILTIFDHDNSSNDGVAEFCNSDDLFGLGCTPIKREMYLVHKTNILGGSYLNPEVTWVALLGNAKAATPIEFDGKESLKQVSFLVAPWDELMTACASTMDFEALTPSVNDAEVKVGGVVCIPPLMAESEMNSVSKKTTYLVIAFMVAMTASDDLPGQALTADKAMAHIQYAVKFCRAAHKKLTPVMCYTVGSRNARISAWATVLHTAHIVPLNINMHTGMAPSDAIMHGGDIFSCDPHRDNYG
jgi:hypothetical protein